MIANSFRLRGQLDPAISCVHGLTQFFRTQLHRFREVIADPINTLKEGANCRPHIRFAAQNMAELPEKWPHAQNDSLGQVLWFRFVLANTNVTPLTSEDADVYALFPPYFEAIRYWQDRDSGAWEEGLAGLAELLRYLDCARAGKKSEMHSLRDIDTDNLRELIAKGRQRLEDTLPFEAPPERLADSTLLFLIHPMGVLGSRRVEEAILNLVQACLKGEVGIIRYVGDSYFCQDYDEWFPPEEMSSDFSVRLDFRDAHLQPNCEAQWCIFDPLLSIIYGERHLANRSDLASFRKQVHYFNRSQAQIISKGQCPELYFLKNGRYIANDHTPLAWTQANQAFALHLMEQSIGD